MIAALIATALFFTDATPHEARILQSIAAHESGFRRDVATCRVLGDGGRAYGVGQIHPRSAAEAKCACDITCAPALMLARVRESVAACAHLPAPERLSLYTSGSCGNRGGRAASRLRWSE